MLQLRLVAQQQGKRLGLLDCDLDACRGFGWAVDAHLHVAEFGRIEPHGQPLRAVRCMAHLHERRRDLRGGRCGV